jgi:hypothetical protein
MAVVMNISDNNYIGTLTATAAVKPGNFVIPDYSTGTATVPADDTAADAIVALVCNVNTNIDEQGVADADFTVGTGEYLRLKYLKVGDVFTTDIFTGTYSGINVDDIFAPGGGGPAEAIAVRAPIVKLQVVEKTTLNGANALKFVVIAA